MNEPLLLIVGAILGGGGVILGQWLQQRRTPPAAPPDLQAQAAAAAKIATARLAPQLAERVQFEVAAALTRQARPTAGTATEAAAPPEAAPPAIRPEMPTDPLEALIDPPEGSNSPPETPINPSVTPIEPQEGAIDPPAPPVEPYDLLAERRRIQVLLDGLETRRTILPPDVFSRRRSALYAELETLAAREQAARADN